MSNFVRGNIGKSIRLTILDGSPRRLISGKVVAITIFIQVGNATRILMRTINPIFVLLWGYQNPTNPVFISIIADRIVVNIRGDVDVKGSKVFGHTLPCFTHDVLLAVTECS